MQHQLRITCKFHCSRVCEAPCHFEPKKSIEEQIQSARQTNPTTSAMLLPRLPHSVAIARTGTAYIQRDREQIYHGILSPCGSCYLGILGMCGGDMGVAWQFWGWAQGYGGCYVGVAIWELSGRRMMLHKSVTWQTGRNNADCARIVQRPYYVCLSAKKNR